jgi:hypothetical protein
VTQLWAKVKVYATDATFSAPHATLELNLVGQINCRLICAFVCGV